MSITDELRKWAKQNQSHGEVFGGLPPKHPFNRCCAVEDLLAIVDRIDAEYDDAVRKKAAKMLTNVTAYMDADDLAEIGLTRLPTDADGVPILFKDKVTVPWSDKVYEVNGFSYQENLHLGTMTVWINTHEDGEYKALCAVDSCRHYKPPTTEDVLRECCNKYHALLIEGMSDIPHDMPAPGEIIAEYAKRLQLKEVDA